jgi:hypothetical protein
LGVLNTSPIVVFAFEGETDMLWRHRRCDSFPPVRFNSSHSMGHRPHRLKPFQRSTTKSVRTRNLRSCARGRTTRRLWHYECPRMREVSNMQAVRLRLAACQATLQQP